MLTNAVELLKNDHQTLIHIMENIEGLISAKNRAHNQGNLKNLFETFKKTYFSHDKAEDKIFYPCLKKFDQIHPLVLKSYQAHQMINIGILALKIVPYSSEKWGPRFLVLKDSMVLHINEEENALFSKATSLLNKEVLEKIGSDIINFRNKK